MLVGGFAANDWLFNSVQSSLNEHDLTVLRPENHVWASRSLISAIQFSLILTSFFRNKAASDGAISFYLDHAVKFRVAKITYGAFCTQTYNPNDPEHVERSAKTYRNAQGSLRIPGCFSIILAKVKYQNVQLFASPNSFFLQMNIGYSSFRGQGV